MIGTNVEIGMQISEIMRVIRMRDWMKDAIAEPVWHQLPISEPMVVVVGDVNRYELMSKYYVACNWIFPDGTIQNNWELICRATFVVVVPN